MRHSSVPRLMSGFVASVLMSGLSCWFSSCIDDPFGKYRQGISGPLSFAVNVPGGWTEGPSRAASDISIKKLSQSAGLQQLYLVTEVSEAAVEAAASEAVTRGTPVVTGDEFVNKSFGLSAICYVGGWPDNVDDEKQLTTNFAHNLKVKKSGTGTDWIPESKLDWLGSGNIKFFAYSPYSGDFKADTESENSSESVNGGSLIHSASDAKGIPTLTYTVPANAKNQPDLMVAVADVHDQGNNGAVPLQFRHVLTAVTVKTGTDMLKGTIKKVTFSGVYGKGIYKFAAHTGDAGSWTIPDNETAGSFIIERDVTVSNTEDTGNTEVAGSTQDKENNYVDPDNPVSIVDGEFTLMMIPQTLSKETKLTIVFVNEMTGTEHELTANLSPEGKTEWGIGKKIIYSVSTTGIVITPVVEFEIDGQKVAPYSVDGQKIDEESKWKDSLCISGYLPNVQLTAYARVVQEGKSEDYVRLPYVIECSTDKGQTWSSTVQTAHSGSIDIWNPTAETTRISGEDVTKPVSGVMCLPQQPAYAKMQQEFSKLKTNTNITASTKDSPYDLTQGEETANCYIVNQPGYYSFPAIYGNTRKRGTIGSGKDGEPNTAAYNISKTSENEYVLEQFVKHDDQPISSIQVGGAQRAALVWQDAPNLVTDVDYDANTNMIKFHIAKETLTQGNAVIAVLDGEGEDAKILWSWHIWATHYTWYDGYVENDYKVESAYKKEGSSGPGKSFYLAPCNLGYCDSHEGNNQRTIQVRFRFTLENVVGDGKKKDVIFHFPQPGIIESLGGDNTYFQWGRKDPMLAGVYNAATIANEKNLASQGDPTRTYKGQLTMVNKKYYPGIRKFGRGKSRVSIGEAIRNPNLYYMGDRGDDNTTRSHWHNGEKAAYGMKQIINLWDSKLESGGSDKTICEEFDFEGAKSVYDPSPAGYHIPPVNAFTGFGTDKFKLSAGPNNISKYDSGDSLVIERVVEKGHIKGWNLRSAATGKFIFFPGCGLRDMGENSAYPIFQGTWAAHAQLTFIATSSMLTLKNAQNAQNAQNVIFYLDNRDYGMDNPTYDVCSVNIGSNKAYGFTVRPVKDNP